MNLSEYKDIIKQAIANEVEARKFYEDAASALSDPYLKKLFTTLAEEEKKHRDILTKIYTSNTIDRYFSETRDYKVAETMEEPELSMDMKPADAFALAMKKEEGETLLQQVQGQPSSIYTVTCCRKPTAVTAGFPPAWRLPGWWCPINIPWNAVPIYPRRWWRGATGTWQSSMPPANGPSGIWPKMR